MTETNYQFLNTRPNPMGEALTQLAQAQHIQCIAAPMITTENIEIPSIVDDVAKQSQQDHCWIFVSRTAVREFATQLTRAEVKFSPSGLVIAVGPGTKQELDQHFEIASDIIVPPASNSESLLSLEALSAAFPRPVTVVKGENGRALLHQTLQQRGYSVELMDVYRRVTLKYSSDQVATWRACQGIVATSVDIAEGVLSGIKQVSAESQQSFLQNTDWIVLSERIKQYLHSQGVTNNRIFVCEDADNSSIIKQINQLAK